MAAPLSPSAGILVAVHLLDSAQGNALQTWRFTNQPSITIGRDEKNDIVLADPQVSRSHARLAHAGGTWTLYSTGRHGTLINDRLISDTVIEHQTVFRLGATGPMLRFDTQPIPSRRNETMENISPDMFSGLAVDEERKQFEVEQFTENALFRELQEKSRQRRTGGSPPKQRG
jgi:pSer/pThr/pTyr-binding forkhead associated (FHA) protein